MFKCVKTGKERHTIMKVCFFKDDIWEFNPIYQQQYYDMPVKHLPSTAIWWPPTAPGSLWVNTEQQRQAGMALWLCAGVLQSIKERLFFLAAP